MSQESQARFATALIGHVPEVVKVTGVQGWPYGLDGVHVHLHFPEDPTKEYGVGFEDGFIDRMLPTRESIQELVSRGIRNTRRSYGWPLKNPGVEAL